MIIVYAIHYSCLPDHVFMGMINSLTLNCLKNNPLKLITVNKCQPFEPHEPHVIFVEYHMYLRLLYFSIIWIKIPNGYQIARVRRN